MDSKPAVAVATQALTLPPLGGNGDTTLRSGAPFANDGLGATLGVTSASVADIKRSIVRFDQAQIQAAVTAGNVLYSARLDMKLVGVSAGWRAEVSTRCR